MSIIRRESFQIYYCKQAHGYTKNFRKLQIKRKHVQQLCAAAQRSGPVTYLWNCARGVKREWIVERCVIFFSTCFKFADYSHRNKLFYVCVFKNVRRFKGISRKSLKRSGARLIRCKAHEDSS